MDLTIRPATADDAKPINDLANWYISNTPVNFDTEPWTLTKRRDWLLTFQSPYYCLVAELDRQFVGFANNSRFRPKAAYDSSTETTLYIDSGSHSRGIGKALYQALLSKVSEEEFHRAYAVITLPNAASIRLHEGFDFKPVGTFDEIGKKFGEFHSVIMLEKRLGEQS